MNYKLLGKSGLRVSELALGAMTFGEEWGFGTDIAGSRKVFDAYTEAGGNFIDTANRYNEGESERQLARLIDGRRDSLVLASKYTLSMNDADPNAGGNHRKNMVRSLEESLKRLETDYIDLYWLHMWDFTTPIEEVMRGLDDHVRAGKLLYIGISDTPAWIVSRCNTMAELRGWTPFIAMQLKYSLLERNIEREFFPMANELGLSVTAWGALNYGLLSGKYRLDNDRLISPDGETRYKENQSAIMTERNIGIIKTLSQMSEETGRTMPQLAIRWAMQKGTIPIVGGRTGDQMKENLQATEFTLTDAQMQTLDNASKIEQGFPYDFLKSDGVRKRIFGSLAERGELSNGSLRSDLTGDTTNR